MPMRLGLQEPMERGLQAAPRSRACGAHLLGAPTAVHMTSEAEQAAGRSDQHRQLPPYLARRRPLLRFGHPLVHVEHTGDVQLDAVQVAADDSPQPEHAGLGGLADLRGQIVQQCVRVSACLRKRSTPVDRPPPGEPPAPAPVRCTRVTPVLSPLS